MTPSTTSPTAPSAPSAPSTRLRPLPLRLSLPLALQLDAAVTGANGVAYLLGATLLDGVLGVEAPALRAAGAFLVVYAAVVAAVGVRRPVPRRAAMVVVAANVVWAVASLAAAATAAGTPTAAGSVWIVVQAAAVTGFAGLQWAALRRPA